MMRVVSTSGGGIGGTDNPIVMQNVLPAHTHTFSTSPGGGHSHPVNIGQSGANHTHPISITAADINHTHSFSTDYKDINHTHAFSTNPSGDHQHPGVIRSSDSPLGGWDLEEYHGPGPHHYIGYGNSDGGGNHAHSGGTSGMEGQDPRHNHTGNTAGMSSASSHSHSGTCQNSDASHTHTGSCGAIDNHTHSGATDSTGKEGGWTPRYIDVIIAAKAK
jgi:hypothetical protein